MISTVPTVLQRQGIFTEAIGGRVPVIYDPATTVGSVRTPFPGNTIPAEPDGSGGARSAAAISAADVVGHRPTTTAGPTTKSTTRISGTSASITSSRSNRDQVFARLSYFRDGFVPVTPLPDGSGVTTGTLGPQDTTAWAFASNYQHTFSNNLLNELRIGDTRRAVGRTAAQLVELGGRRAEHSRHSVDRAVSRTRCRRF